MAKKAEEVTVEAELTVTSSRGRETVRRFDRAWTLARERAEEGTPVTIRLEGFVRKGG